RLRASARAERCRRKSIGPAHQSDIAGADRHYRYRKGWPGSRAQVQWRLPGHLVHRKTHVEPARDRQGQGLLRHHGWAVRDGWDGDQEVTSNWELGIQN